MRVSADCLAAAAEINGCLSLRGKRLKPFDLARGNNVGVAPLQFRLGPQLIKRLFQGLLGLLKLALAGQNVGFSRRLRCLHFDHMGASGLERRFLPRAVQLEDRVALFDLLIIADINLSHATTDLRIYRNGSEQRGDVARRRMIVQHHRDQKHRQYQAERDAPAKFVPDREQRDLVAKALALHVAPEQIIRKKGEHGAHGELKHGPIPSYPDGDDQCPRSSPHRSQIHSQG